MRLNISSVYALVLTAFLCLSLPVFAEQSKAKAPETTSQTQGSNFKSYREWKNSMILAATDRIQRVKQSLEQQRKISAAGGSRRADPNLKNQLSKEELQATIANELTINDYFVGYLNKQSNAEQAIQIIAGKMSGAEVAELMSAYAYNFNKIEYKPLKSAMDAGSKANSQ